MHTRTYALVFIQGGQRNAPYIALLNQFLVPALLGGHIPHEVESEAPFKLGASRGNGNLRKDAVVSAGIMCPDKQDLASHSLVFGFPLTGPVMVGRLDAALLPPGQAME